MATRLDFVGSISKGASSTPQGGLRSLAAVTRTGVFTYRDPDGTIRRELRHPEDVFSTDSLETLRGAPVVLGHPAVITADNWTKFAIGTVGDEVAANGTHVDTEVRIQDSATKAAIEAGGLKEFSCGYSCDYEPVGGTYDGEEYDGRQRNIRYNHVGLGPPGWGRAGSTVALKFDSDYSPTMANSTVQIHTDGESKSPPKEEPKTPPAPPAPILPAPPVVRSDADSRIDSLLTSVEREKGRADAAEAAVAKLTADLATATDVARIDGMVKARLHLLDQARGVLGSDFVADGKSDREVQIATVQSVDSAFVADGKSDEYVAARFDSTLSLRSLGALANVQRVTSDAASTEGEDPIEAARKRNAERSANLWKKA